MFAEFCDGVEVKCNGLEQWGSVSLANEGYTAESILKYFYGENIEIVKNVPIDGGVPLAPTLDLTEGDTNPFVQLMQIRLNRISANYPGIPKIYPADGFFDRSTTDAVRKFQEVFNLTQDGIIGKATWNRINAIYTAVKKLQTVSSEGLTISELESEYETELSIGQTSEAIYVLQYYLAYIALFDNRIIAPSVDGVFGSNTRESVISYQKAYNLYPDGIVGELTWNSIENTYYSILRSIPYTFEPGLILPFPGRILRIGIEGDDVRALQGYLNYISEYNPAIPKIAVDGVYGRSTADAVLAFKNYYGLPSDSDRVNALTWNEIVRVYDDLYTGAMVRSEQFPGYNI